MSIYPHTTHAAWQWNPPRLQPDTGDSFDLPENVQSATECTGLMQIVPDCQTAADAISGLYAIHPVKPQGTISSEPERPSSAHGH